MRPQKKLHGEGTDTQNCQPWTDIATTRKNWPKGRFFENTNFMHYTFNCTYKYLIIFLFIVLKCIEDKTACPMYSTALFSAPPYLAALYSAPGSTQLHGSDMLLCLSPSQRTKSSRDLKGGALCKYTIIYLTNFNHATNVTLYDGQHD